MEYVSSILKPKVKDQGRKFNLTDARPHAVRVYTPKRDDIKSSNLAQIVRS